MLSTKRIAAAFLLAGFWSGPALAHGSERGFVLLLPTNYYLFGGAVAVAASFLLLWFVPGRGVERLVGARLRLGTVPIISPGLTSCASFLVLLLLLTAGFIGSRDPLRNPLPLVVWTIWWVGFPLLHAVLGNIWAYLNPWTGPYRFLDWLVGGRLSRTPPLHYPNGLEYWPSLVFFAGFAWLELVYPAPDDPERLAYVVGAYWLVVLTGMILFGERVWTERAEPFSTLFRLIARLAPLRWERAEAGRTALALAFPGAALAAAPALPISGALFLLLTLSSVSFDGLSKTFWWLGLGGINPLEFPGRSAVIGRNTFGLALAFLILAFVTWAAVVLGSRMVGGKRRPILPFGHIVLSLVPISLAFHIAHYLTALMVDGQYASLAMTDPFGRGADLFGLGHMHVTTGFLNTYSGVRAIWNLQTAAIVAGHVIAVLLAHAMALRCFGDRRQAALSQTPLAVLMVLYTVFGLWLLSTPASG